MSSASVRKACCHLSPHGQRYGRVCMCTSEADLTAIAETTVEDMYLPATLPCKRRQAEQRQGRQYKNLKKVLQQEQFGATSPAEANYMSIEAPPPRYPPKKFCDVTGLEAPYTDPKTGLRYANAASYALASKLSEPYVQGYLGLRRSSRGVLK